MQRPAAGKRADSFLAICPATTKIPTIAGSFTGREVRDGELAIFGVNLSMRAGRMDGAAPKA